MIPTEHRETASYVEIIERESEQATSGFILLYKVSADTAAYRLLQKGYYKISVSASQSTGTAAFLVCKW